MNPPRTDWAALAGPDGHHRMLQLLGAATSAPVRVQERAWRRFAEAMTDEVDRLGTDQDVVRDTWDGDASEAAVALAERVRGRARALVSVTTALAADLGSVADAIDTAHRQLPGTDQPPVWDPVGWAGAQDPATDTARRVMTTLSDEYVRAGAAMPVPLTGPPTPTVPPLDAGPPLPARPGDPGSVGGHVPQTGRPGAQGPGTTLGVLGGVAFAPGRGRPPLDGDPGTGRPVLSPDPSAPPVATDPSRGGPPQGGPLDRLVPDGGAQLAGRSVPGAIGVGRLLTPGERSAAPGLGRGGLIVPMGRVGPHSGAATPTASVPVVDPGPPVAGEAVPAGSARTDGLGTVVSLGAVTGTFAAGSWTGGGTVRSGRFSRLVGRLTGRAGRTAAAPSAESFGTPVVQHDAAAADTAEPGTAGPPGEGGGRLPGAPNTVGGGTGGGDDARRRASWLTEQEDVWGIGTPGVDGVLGGPAPTSGSSS